MLATRGDSNYYHFLHDCLPRTAVLEQCPEAGPVDRWYVPRATRFQRELLELWGIGEDQVVDSATVPHVRAEHLVVPGVASHHRAQPAVGGPAPAAAPAARRRCQRVPGRHLYLTRGTARNNRMVLNEAEVLRLLEPLGFTSVDPGELSVADQIRTFAEADVIVAPHGAALANLVFCSPGATLIEIFPAMSFVADYWKMASRGHRPRVPVPHRGRARPWAPPGASSWWPTSRWTSAARP